MGQACCRQVRSHGHGKEKSSQESAQEKGKEGRQEESEEEKEIGAAERRRRRRLPERSTKAGIRRPLSLGRIRCGRAPAVPPRRRTVRRGSRGLASGEPAVYNPRRIDTRSVWFLRKELT